MIIGQENARKELSLLRQQIVKGNKVAVLITGKSGYGKTTLAMDLVKSTHMPYSLTVGNERPNFKKSLVVIDEVHEYKKPIELYHYVDTGDQSFILLTTELGDLLEPLVNRCFHIELVEYTLPQLKTLAQNVSKSLSAPALSLAVERCRGVPRQLVKIIERLELHAEGRGLSKKDADSILETVGIYEGGFTSLDKRYMEYLTVMGTAGLGTISKYLGAPKDTLENFIEPFLLRNGLITITPKGRKLNDNNNN